MKELKSISLVFSFSFLVASTLLVFQNCGQGQNLTASSEDLRSQANEYALIDAHERVLKARPMTSEELQSASQKPGDRLFRLSVEAGTIQAFNAQGEPLQANPMPLLIEDREDLQELMAEAELCTPAPPAPEPKIVCSTLYSPPYAELVHKDHTQPLGEARSGCEKPIDLCGEKSQQLKELLLRIIENQANL